VVAAVRHAATEEIDADLIARQPIVVAHLQGTLALSRSRLPRAAIAAMLRDEFGAMHVEVMDRDLLGTTEIGTMLVDGDDLEQVADRARAVAADLLRAGGIAVGRESELATTLIDMKTQLHGSAKNPSGEVLQSLRQQILPFVEFEEEEAVGTAADAAEEADAIPDDDDDPEGGAA
jgi:hypothetical protein